MSVETVNLRLDKGTNFNASFSPTVSSGGAMDLSNKTATSKLKKTPTSGTAYTFTSSIVSNVIKLSMTPEETSVIPSGISVYDIIVTDQNGEITKLFDGNISVYESASV